MQLNDLDPVFADAGREWNVDPRLLKAMAVVESGGKVNAVSGAGAGGLMQILPRTAKSLGVTNVNDPVQSIWGAAKYMSGALASEKTPEDALRNYHGGPGWALPQNYGPESRAYAPKVTAAYMQVSDPLARAKAAAMPPGAAPAVDATDDFLSGKTAAPPAVQSAGAPAGTTAPAPDAVDDFLSGKGATPPPPPPAPTALERQNDDAASAIFPSGKWAPPDRAGDANLARWTVPDGQTPTIADIRRALAPIPGYVSSSVLPLAAKEVAPGQGDINAGVKLDWGPLRPAGNALLDLLEGTGQATSVGGPNAPLAGRVSPDASALLFSAMAGGNPLAARSTILAGPLQRGATLSPAEATAALARGDAKAAPLPSDFQAAPTAPGYAGAPNNRLATVQLPIGDARILQIPARDAPSPAPASANPNLPANMLAQATGNAPAGPAATPTMTVRPGDPSGAPGPQSVGAAASRDNSPPGAIDMTPAEVQAYRSTAEGQKLLEPQQTGIEDRTAYVPGVSASAAEVEQTVNAARDAKAANIKYQEVSQEAKDVAGANNEARHQYLENTVRSPIDVVNAKSARSAQADQDLATAFGNKTEADVTPIVEHIEEVLNQPRNRQNDELRSYVQPLIDRLVNEDGTPKITDPEELYGFREAVAKMTSAASRRKDPGLEHVTSQLNDIIGVTDPQIESAAPGYRQYMDNYAANSRPIDEMELLQGIKNRMYDSQARLQLSRVQGVMRNIVDSRAAPGINPYKSISDETMQRLWNLRDDLRRSASAQELARTPGSDTAQTMFDLAKRTAATGADLIAYGAAHKVAPLLGPFLYKGIKEGVSNKRAAAAAARERDQALRNLNSNRLVPRED